MKDVLGGISRRNFMRGGVASSICPSIHSLAQSPAAIDGDDRQYWVDLVRRVSSPVLSALSERKFKSTMPVESPRGAAQERKRYTYLEATGRLLAGLAPWLETGPENGVEGTLRRQFIDQARAAIEAATDPASPDFMNFNQGQQPVVDTAFLSLAILRAPTELWHKLDTRTQRHLIAALQSSRVIVPSYNNWLLFSAMVEAALAFMEADWDRMRIDYAIRSLDSWYKGDGVYGDGPLFHWDYYDSFVMHPFLLTILDVTSQLTPRWKDYRSTMTARAERYAEIQERLISPEGTYPPIGRSLCYRFGAFHLLADISLRRRLPDSIAPEQVRCALTAVMRRMMDAPGTFDREGWLTVGFCGHQPAMAEGYISTGSLYLCSTAWLPLGLPASDSFWAGKPRAWTARKAWMGESVNPDHALD